MLVLFFLGSLAQLTLNNNTFYLQSVSEVFHKKKFHKIMIPQLAHTIHDFFIIAKLS